MGISKNQIKKVIVGFSPVVIALLSTACGSLLSGDTATATSTEAVSLSGSLNATTSSARISSREQFLRTIGGGIGQSLLTDYSIYNIRCATASVPPVESLSAVNANGTFGISVAEGKKKALNCAIVDVAGEVVAPIIMTDASSKDMKGNSQVNNAPAFAANAQLGVVNLDLSTGSATVPVAQVQDTNGNSALVSAADVAASGPLFDPTGKWQIADVDFTLPHGVRGTCTTAEQNANTCNGPPIGQNLYLNRLHGLTVPGSADVYGLQVWIDSTIANDPQASLIACGSMTGLSASDATNAGVDLSSYGSSNGAFTFTTHLTDTHASAPAVITEGYKSDTARAQWDMQACVSKNITQSGITYHAYVCGPDTAGNGTTTGNSPGGQYQANLGGGCVVTATGKTIPNMDWSKVNWPGSTCINAVSAVTGFYKNTCTTNYDTSGANTPITCTNEWGVFTNPDLASGHVVASPGSTCGTGHDEPCAPDFNYAGVTKYASKDDLCSTMTNDLAQANCYASYYEQYIEREATGCLPRVDIDWSATTAANFAKASFKPSNLVFMEKLSYADAKTASMLTQQTNGRGVEVKDSSGNSQWVNCPSVEQGGLSFTKVTANKIAATYESTVTTYSTEPACVGAAWNGKKEKFLFYLIKQ